MIVVLSSCPSFLEYLKQTYSVPRFVGKEGGCELWLITCWRKCNPQTLSTLVRACVLLLAALVVLVALAVSAVPVVPGVLVALVVFLVSVALAVSVVLDALLALIVLDGVG